MINQNLNLSQAVKPLEYTGKAVKNDVQRTAETMFVTKRTGSVLDVRRDGRAKFVTQV